MTKAKNDLPQEKSPAAQEPEKKGETSPNGAEKNSQNDADGSQNADAQTDAPASDDGKGGGDPLSDEVAHQPIVDELFDKIGMRQVQQDGAPWPDVVMSIAVIETIKSIAMAAVQQALPQMLAEVEAARLANADQAEKDRRDAELAEQRKQEQAARTRQRREERDRQKADEDRAEARAVELQASADFYAHISEPTIERAEIVAQVQAADELLVCFADGKRFNIDVREKARKSSLKMEGGMLFLQDRVDIAVDVPADTITECWLIPVNDPGALANCGLRCDLGGAIAIGGGRPVTLPPESIAWRC